MKPQNGDQNWGLGDHRGQNWGMGLADEQNMAWGQ